jgi:hypothetical protein
VENIISTTSYMQAFAAASETTGERVAMNFVCAGSFRGCWTSEIRVLHG